MRLGSVTRAAEELALAQPTVSGLLRKLADTFGAPVLRARNGRMELTEAGREAALLCHEILAALERHEARRVRHEPARIPAANGDWPRASAAAGG